MAYGPDTDTGERTWEATFTHSGTGIQIHFEIIPWSGSGAPSEAQFNSVFQALIDRLAGMPGATMNSATKRTWYASEITITP